VRAELGSSAQKWIQPRVWNKSHHYSAAPASDGSGFGGGVVDYDALREDDKRTASPSSPTQLSSRDVNEARNTLAALFRVAERGFDIYYL
jgi:hypothetical protein